MNKQKFLDQFYTSDIVANKCTATVKNILGRYMDLEKTQFLEPSAGAGAFIRALEKLGFEVRNSEKVISLDIDPQYENVLEMDFFEFDAKSLKLNKRDLVVTIGNPPFGRRSKLAIDFFNHAAQISDTIAFVVPLQFQKWSVQSNLNKDFKLIYDKELPNNSFVFEGKEYNVGCCFQIWTRLDTRHRDLRMRKAPSTKHKDFEMFQYNNTIQAIKFFDKDIYEWDFAVPRQGYYDYERRETKPENMERNIQWIFFKANNKDILKRLIKLDFKKLSRKNTTVPGFGKADVVKEYNRVLKKDKALRRKKTLNGDNRREGD